MNDTSGIWTCPKFTRCISKRTQRPALKSVMDFTPCQMKTSPKQGYMVVGPALNSKEVKMPMRNKDTP